MAVAEGGTVLEHPESSVVGPGGRRLWWIDRVAVLTDHESLLADQGTDAADELLFTLSRPTLVVADRSFAGVCWRRASRWWHSPTSTRWPSRWRRGEASRPGSSRSTSAGPRHAYSPLVELVAERTPTDADFGLAELPVVDEGAGIPSPTP